MRIHELASLKGLYNANATLKKDGDIFQSTPSFEKLFQSAASVAIDYDEGSAVE